jgi:cell pole-organizing protein PopZ
MFTVMGTQESEGQRRQLMPSEVNNAVHSAWNALAHTVLVENGRTLEDLVREMLRPMLKAWLDDNLPTLVERLVLAEIEQMTGRKPRSAR